MNADKQEERRSRNGVGPVCLFLLIRVHPRSSAAIVACLPWIRGKKREEVGYELEFCGGGVAGQVRLRGAGVRERGGAAAAVPGADSVGDLVYGGGGAGGGGEHGTGN